MTKPSILVNINPLEENLVNISDILLPVLDSEFPNYHHFIVYSPDLVKGEMTLETLNDAEYSQIDFDALKVKLENEIKKSTYSLEREA